MISVSQMSNNIPPFMGNNKEFVDEEGYNIIDKVFKLIKKAFIPEELLSTTENIGILEEKNMASLYLNMILSAKYTFRNLFKVTEFIKNNPFLIPLLLDAEKNIGKYFLNNELFLEIVHDVEDPDFEELMIFIRTNLPPKEALDKLDRIDEEWWLDASLESKGKLNINIEFE